VPGFTHHPNGDQSHREYDLDVSTPTEASMSNPFSLNHTAKPTQNDTLKIAPQNLSNKLQEEESKKTVGSD
jgi:hypothetical protein